MKNGWVVIANSSYAEIFRVDAGKIEKVESLSHPAGREKPSQLISDRPGRTFAIASSERHALGEGHNIHRHEQNVFAHEIYRHCLKAKERKAFEKIAFVAPPEFLGEMRKVMRGAFDDCLEKEVAKDLPGTLSEREKVEHLKDYLKL